uniref:uncharacterized protein LOC108949759 n=1 Tax=Ciona intestinalis TaxID=7719 RepID=UPI00089DAA85|nr:uncharacterized protein LOC108949759 [Ciona intestinalis]|eukprot:XP_018668846.1 uncharacterized protein LOC108949759 [Ciona intestinalis]
MPGTAALNLPDINGRLHQQNHVPIYKSNRKRRNVYHKFNQEVAVRQIENYDKFLNVRHNPVELARTSLTGSRQTLTLPKVEAKYLKSKSKLNHHEIPLTLEDRAYENGRTKKEGSRFLANSMPDKQDETTRVHLPSLVNPFVPKEDRKVIPKLRKGIKPTWIDLTGQSQVKQVAPVNSHEKDLDYQRVTLVTVDYSPSPAKLSRRPLPPTSPIPPISSVQPPISTAIWQPAESRSTRSRDFAAVGQNSQQQVDGDTPATNAGKHLLDSLLQKLDQARKLNLSSTRGLRDPRAGERFWESSTKSKTLKSRSQKRIESDRHFGNLKTGVILNKLPSDLMGNLQNTYQSLSHYLKRTDPYFQARREMEKEKVKPIVYIPTGRAGESENDEENLNEFGRNRSISHLSDVTMRYVHRESNDTPSLDHMPWDDPPEVRKKKKIEPGSVSVHRVSDTEQKTVKRLTITLPSVPPSTPDPLVWRKMKEQKKKVRKEEDECKMCEDTKVAKREDRRSNKVIEAVKKVPIVSVTEPALSKKLDAIGKESFRKNWLEVKPNQITTVKEETADDLNSQKVDSLTEKLILKHGEMKRRHQCPRKEVVIAPFSVKVDETDVRHLNENGAKKFEQKISPSYTFSYIPSSVRKAKIPKSRELNSKIATAIRNGPESSFISSFVPDASALIRDKNQKVDAHANINESKERVRSKVESRRLQRMTVRQAIEVEI